MRLKTILFLQASELYNVDPICIRLQEHEKLLSLELAIVEGKVKRNSPYLTDSID